MPLTRRQRRRVRLRRAWRHAHTEILYLGRIFREFRFSLIFAGLIWALSTVALHHGYPLAPGEDPMTWDRAAYYVLVMTAFEAALEFHPHAPWFVKLVFYALPLLGLFVIIDAIVRFTQVVFERRTNTKEWYTLLASTYQDHVIVCGLGHVGYRTMQQLLGSQCECVGIELQANPFASELASAGVPVLYGDTRNNELLLQAGVKKARAIIVATDNDIVNIETALSARELAPTIRTVIRLFDQKLAQKVEKLVEIDAAFSTSELAAPVLAASALSKRVLHSFVVRDVVLNTIELTVTPGSKLEGQRLEQIQARLEVTFLLLRDDHEIDWNPRGEKVLRAGNTVMVVATADIIQKLESLNDGREG
jgi:Trk K+ transport system NAD-binding subunit